MILILLLLLPSITSAKVSFGLAPLDRGFSVWYAGDKTWVGVELDRLELEYNKEEFPDIYREYASPEPTPLIAIDHLKRKIRYSMAAKRILGSGEVRPFVYLRLYIGLYHDEWENYFHNNWNENGPELGVGILWCPFSRASIAIRQGFAWESNTKPPEPGRWFYSSDMTTTVLRLQETRLLVLYHF